MSVQLEGFDVRKKCPKCNNHASIRTEFCKGITNRYARPLMMWCWQEGDRGHLHRICNRCGYVWLTEPADSCEGK